MNDTYYLFVEDARLSKKKVLTLMIISYVLSAILLILAILYTEGFKNFGDAFKLLVLFMLLFLIFAIYLNWGYCSKYLKFYIYISNEKIVFLLINKSIHTL